MLMKIEYVQKTFSLEEISTLILKIANTYNIVSYHNFSHGFNLFNVTLPLASCCSSATRPQKNWEESLAKRGSSILLLQLSPTMQTIVPIDPWRWDEQRLLNKE